MKYPLPSAPKTLAVLRELHRGRKLTPLDALRLCNVLSLSQRVGDLKRLGWKIKSTPKTLPSGSRVSEYSL